MTTIAYKDNVVAYDSYATKGDRINDADFNKRVIRDGVHFFFGGCIIHQELLIKAYFGEVITKVCNAYAFAVDNGLVYEIAVSEELGFYKEPVTTPWAIGSGQDFAIGAMDAGCSATEAVIVACGRDPYTGGRVRIYTINDICSTSSANKYES